RAAQASRTPSRRRMPGRVAWLTLDLDPSSEAHAQRAPALKQLEQLGADDRAPPALQRAHLPLAAAGAHRGDDPLQVRARGDELVGELGLGGARAHERLAQGDQRRVAGGGGGGAVAVDRDRLTRAAALDDLEDRAPAATQRALVEPADLGQALQ